MHSDQIDAAVLFDKTSRHVGVLFAQCVNRIGEIANSNRHALCSGLQNLARRTHRLSRAGENRRSHVQPSAVDAHQCCVHRVHTGAGHKAEHSASRMEIAR